MYHYQSMIHDLLQYSKEYKKEVLALSGYFDEDQVTDTDFAGI